MGYCMPKIPKYISQDPVLEYYKMLWWYETKRIQSNKRANDLWAKRKVYYDPKFRTQFNKSTYAGYDTCHIDELGRIVTGKDI